MRERRRVVGSVATATATLLLLLVIRPLPAERLVSIYVLVLAAIALASLTRLAQHELEGRRPSPFERALAERNERGPRPPELVRTERELVLGTSSAGHAHRRLLPLLRDAAAARLYAHHGVDLVRRPGRARELLGDETWELLRPDRPEPEDRNARGLPLAEVAAAIDRLDRI
jgi:hypothetical protein